MYNLPFSRSTIFGVKLFNSRPNGKFFICELHPFKQYTGSKAKFENKNGILELEVFTHHISEYVNCAIKNGFKLLELEEWFDDEDKTAFPRLISFVFEK